MKNYILFSTNVSNAIDNMSMCVSTELEANEAIRQLRKNCKYSNITVEPIGKPVCNEVEFEVALEILKNLKLHKNHRVIKRKMLDVVRSASSMNDIIVSCDNSKVVLQLNLEYETSNPALLCKEHRIIEELIEDFGCNHVAYHRARNCLELVPSESETIGIDWALVKGDIVQITKEYEYITVEL